jgi:hypothetical protein
MTPTLIGRMSGALNAKKKIRLWTSWIAWLKLLRSQFPTSSKSLVREQHCPSLCEAADDHRDSWHKAFSVNCSETL